LPSWATISFSRNTLYHGVRLISSGVKPKGGNKSFKRLNKICSILWRYDMLMLLRLLAFRFELRTLGLSPTHLLFFHHIIWQLVILIRIEEPLPGMLIINKHTSTPLFYFVLKKIAYHTEHLFMEGEGVVLRPSLVSRVLSMTSLVATWKCSGGYRTYDHP
jgi:hypothetical protein